MESDLPDDKIMVIAIDFGTTYSGYAFSLKQEPLKISENTGWIGGRLMSCKTPTALLLTPDRKLDKFGYEAEDKYLDLAAEDKHKDWYFFSRFKMLLHNKTDLNRDTSIEDETGKSMPAKTVFAHGISFLKDHAMDLMSKRIDTINCEDVHWVLTVPAIWNDQAKQFMREAAQKAGIENNQLSIALEPEAAALYCKNHSDKNGDGLFTVDSRFMVVDLGGGTADITVHKITGDNEMQELHPPSGGAWGGITVDSEFLKLITKIVGKDVMDIFKQDYQSDYIDLQRELEMKKRTMKKEIASKVLLKVPVSLSTVFKEQNGIDIKEKVSKSEFSDKVSWITDKIRVDAELMREMFTFSMVNISEHIRDILGEIPVRGTETFLMVGGYSESPIIQQMMEQKFSNKKIITPMDAGTAVLKGAVLFGHKPMTITSRICRFTYGVAVSKPFVEGAHPKGKKYSAGGRSLCKDIFDKYVEMGETVKTGAVKNCSMPYSSYGRDHRIAKVRVYKSGNKSPEFVTDKGCTQLGELIVYLPDVEDESGGNVEVRMNFGGTELNVEAIESNTGNIYRARFDFLSN